METQWCERCGEKLNPRRIVWLELDQNTGKYHRPEKFPAGATSQGAFAFGTACAKTQLAEDYNQSHQI